VLRSAQHAHAQRTAKYTDNTKMPHAAVYYLLTGNARKLAEFLVIRTKNNQPNAPLIHHKIFNPKSSPPAPFSLPRDAAQNGYGISILPVFVTTYTVHARISIQISNRFVRFDSILRTYIGDTRSKNLYQKFY